MPLCSGLACLARRMTRIVKKTINRENTPSVRPARSLAPHESPFLRLKERGEHPYTVDHKNDTDHARGENAPVRLSEFLEITRLTEGEEFKQDFEDKGGHCNASDNEEKPEQ